MGISVWEFMWCLDKMTKIDEKGVGWVLGGKPIKLSEIAKDLKVHENTVSNNLIKLEKMGYLILIHAPYGISIRVNKAKKRFTKTCEPTSQKPVNLSTETCEPNKTVSVDSISKTIGELSSQPLKVKKKNMKKNSFNYNEGASSDSYEEVIDSDTGEKAVSTKSNASVAMKELLLWAENRRGGKFVNYPKQMKAMSMLRKANIEIYNVKKRWKEMEEDKFWKTAGFDFMDILKSFDKKPV